MKIVPFKAVWGDDTLYMAKAHWRWRIIHGEGTFYIAMTYLTWWWHIYMAMIHVKGRWNILHGKGTFYMAMHILHGDGVCNMAKTHFTRRCTFHGEGTSYMTMAHFTLRRHFFTWRWHILHDDGIFYITQVHFTWRGHILYSTIRLIYWAVHSARSTFNKKNHNNCRKTYNWTKPVQRCVSWINNYWYHSWIIYTCIRIQLYLYNGCFQGRNLLSICSPTHICNSCFNTF